MTSHLLPFTYCCRCHSDGGVDIPAAVLQAVTTGLCDGAVLQQSDWDVSSNVVSVNADCGLTVVGPIVRKLSGAWPYMVDYSDKCTSLVEATFSEIIVNLQADGQIQQLYSNALSKYGDNQCLAGTGSQSNVTVQLGYPSLAGIFVLWSVIAAVAIATHLIPWRHLWESIQRKFSWGPYATTGTGTSDTEDSLVRKTGLPPMPMEIEMNLNRRAQRIAELEAELKQLKNMQLVEETERVLTYRTGTPPGAPGDGFEQSENARSATLV